MGGVGICWEHIFQLFDFWQLRPFHWFVNSHFFANSDYYSKVSISQLQLLDDPTSHTHTHVGACRMTTQLTVTFFGALTLSVGGRLPSAMELST